MPHRLEIALKPALFDAEGESLRKKAHDYFNIHITQVRTVHIITLDADLTSEQQRIVQQEVFTNPVTQFSSFEPLSIAFDWIIWVGYRPGVRDNPGATAEEAIKDLLGISFAADEAIYTSKRFCFSGSSLSVQQMEIIARELLANETIQQWKIYSPTQWDPENGIGYIIPKVSLDHTPTVTTLPIKSDEMLQAISTERNLALNPKDIPTIRRYFLRTEIQTARSAKGLSDPTDVELEYISQARSDHCNHNTFGGRFHYTDIQTGETQVIDNLFKTFIEAPTLALKKNLSWVISVLWDNAGVARFDDQHYYVITGETHNSPSNMEAYGGALTGIVGVYRDPMGTGKGAKLVMGSYGYCVGPRDYQGDLKPYLHPRRLLDGIIEGVKDGGNKSGIPTPFGQVYFHPSYIGKCLVFVTALGILPAQIEGQPAERKKTAPGQLLVMCGGRVGKDGIHGVTASSESYSEGTPAGHVQIGDPYTQKKMHDFLLEARDEGLIRFITDNGGGGLSSSVGESARFSNGCEIELEKVPLKYDGLDQWEIWVSESQERMTVAIAPADLNRFLTLSAKHAVESTVIGRYTDSGKLHITYRGKTCAYVDLDLLTSGFPQWEFEATWLPPAQRGLQEPVLKEPRVFNDLLLELLADPNICSKEWVQRQYDHEVQGSSVIKPLIGVERDIPSDAAVIRPVLNSDKGLAFAQALLPSYSQIDTYHMTAGTIDEAVRRLLSVGADISQIGGVDNFCWPSIQYDPVDNPDGRYKAAQLVRSCQALRDTCLAYEIPLLSGKDSMYVDGYLPGKFGETHKVSALPTLQFSATSLVADVNQCVTMDSKVPGDLVYVLGFTRNELGGSVYYEKFGYTGLNVPQVSPDDNLRIYRLLTKAIAHGLLASAHGVYRGGIGIHLALVAMGGGMGMEINLRDLPVIDVKRSDIKLFSESCGRFILTVDPAKQSEIKKMFAGLPIACVGQVTNRSTFALQDGHRKLVQLDITDLKSAWTKPFGELI